MKVSKLVSICVATLSLTHGLLAFAEDDIVATPGEALATFRIDSAAKSACLPAISSQDADTLIQTNDITFTTYWDRSPSRTIVARIVTEAQRLAGSSFAPYHHFAVEIDENFRILGQQVYDSQLRRPKVIIQEPTNVSLYAHEMGHVIGNSQSTLGGTWYSAYFKAVPTACHPTYYSKSGFSSGRRNEEFAEMSSAFLTNPKLLLNGGPFCRQAYDFFRKNIFPKADPRCLEVAQPTKPIALPKIAIPPVVTVATTPKASPTIPTAPAPLVAVPKPATPGTSPAAAVTKPTVVIPPVVIPAAKPAVQTTTAATQVVVKPAVVVPVAAPAVARPTAITVTAAQTQVAKPAVVAAAAKPAPAVSQLEAKK